MELMDWKSIETESENSIRTAEVQIIISKILLKEAVKEVKKLGGKTNGQLNSEAKRTSKQDEKDIKLQTG